MCYKRLIFKIKFPQGRNDKSRKKIFPDEIFMIVHSVKLFYLLADTLVNCVPEPVPRYLYY